MNIKELWQTIPQLKWSVFVVSIMLVLALLSLWTGNSTPTYSKDYINNLRSLVQQALQWNTTAQQDTNDLVRLMHATSAVAYFNAARTLATGKDLSRISGVNVQEVRDLLDRTQKDAMQRVTHACPPLKPSGVYVMGSGWV